MYKSYIEDIGIMLLRFLTLSKLNFIKYFTKFRVQMPDLAWVVSSLNASMHICTHTFSHMIYSVDIGNISKFNNATVVLVRCTKANFPLLDNFTSRV